MTLRLMLCAFILLALGGCQNPSRIEAASSRSAGNVGHSDSVQSGGPDWRWPYWPVWSPMNIA